MERRALIAGSMAVAASPAFAARAAPVVTLLGDSITAGFGLPAAEALPAQLGAALARLGASAVVRGAGVSGDTTADGLARLDFSVQPDTAVCVVALGGNDLLQGLDPKSVRANLDAIVRRLRTAGLSGATTVRGLWGFHGDHPPHGDRLLQLSRRVPVVTVVIDVPERIAEAFDIIDSLTTEQGLVTSETVPAIRLTGDTVPSWHSPGLGSP